MAKENENKRSQGSGNQGSRGNQGSQGGSSQGKSSSSNRGLASADEETRERVARMGGESHNKNK